MLKSIIRQKGITRATYRASTKKVSERNSKRDEMQKEIETLEERVGTQEKIASNDTVISDNFLIYNDNWPRLGIVLQYFDNFMDSNLQMLI